MELVEGDDLSLYPTKWSSDGKMVAFIQETPNLDLYGVDVTPPHTVRPVATGPGAQVEVTFRQMESG